MVREERLQWLAWHMGSMYRVRGGAVLLQLRSSRSSHSPGATAHSITSSEQSRMDKGIVFLRGVAAKMTQARRRTLGSIASFVSSVVLGTLAARCQFDILGRLSCVVPNGLVEGFDMDVPGTWGSLNRPDPCRA